MTNGKYTQDQINEAGPLYVIKHILLEAQAESRLRDGAAVMRCVDKALGVAEDGIDHIEREAARDE